MLDAEACWAAVQNRDSAQDGVFVYGVITTGVYCRPSCPSRRALRKNVRFFARAQDAEREGLRPCKRCRPRNLTAKTPIQETIHALARQIEAEPTAALRLSDLARRAGYSPSYLQRNFTAVVGSSPKAFQAATRMRLLKHGLKANGTVTSAIEAAGFSSTSRLYEKADAELGMTPSAYRSGGRGLTISHATADTALGRIMIGATDRGICFLQFGRSDRALLAELAREFPGATLHAMPRTHEREFVRWIRALNAYLQGTAPDTDLPLDVRGTAFQLTVWRYLRRIPYGTVQNYAEVAAGIGKPTAARAVARACATNQIAVLIPCHRVVRGTGEIAGYRWGAKRKRALLDLEHAARV